MAEVRRVTVLIETSRAYGRGLLRGVAKYNHERAGWAVYFTPQGLDEPPPAWLKDWKGDGILARIANRRMADAILATGLPVVEFRGAIADLDVPFLGVDNRIVANLALEHLRERGLKQVAFCGLRRGQYDRMDERRDHFLRLAEAAGVSCHVFEPSGRRSKSRDDDRSELAAWVQSLPKPIGIMTCNDDRGLELLSACRLASVLVPEQAAVISCDNDEYLCTLSMPTMSSIDIAPQRIGYLGAQLLDRLMAGEPVAEKSFLSPPAGVVVRQSTDVLATEDPAIVQAVAFIRAHACQRIKLADVVAHVAISRATLEARLKAVLGRTIHQEIQRVQIDMAKQLLADTDYSLKQIARRCGFKYTQHLSRVFRQATGGTPTEFRNQIGGRFIG